MSYVDGYVLPLPKHRIEDYRKMAEATGKIWIEHGALDYRECVLEDEEDKGFCATFPQAIRAGADETIIFAYVTYHSREHRDEVNAKVMADPRIKESCHQETMPFDPKRMAYGGFKTIVGA